MSVEAIIKLKPIHPFPARMAPSIALAELDNGKRKTLKVLDPMMGSGTTIVLSRLMGHKAYGLDIDPLAVMQARTWTLSAKPSLLDSHVSGAMKRAAALNNRLKLRDAFPSNADDETKKFIRFWFDPRARRQLACLALAISEADPDKQNFLNTVLSRTIIAKNRGVSLAMDLSHSRPHRAYTRAPVAPFDEFPLAGQRILRDAPFLREKRGYAGPSSVLDIGDARKIRRTSNQFDLVLTSPPYLNAIDYLRCSKFALVWMGHTIAQLRETRKKSIGAEVSLPPDETAAALDLLKTIPARKKLPERDAKVLDRYIVDMQLVMRETSRLLKDTGRAVFVVGDSRLKGVFVSNSRIVEKLGEQYDLKLLTREKREIPANRRYLPPPVAKSGASMKVRMGHEVILTFTRKAR